MTYPILDETEVCEIRTNYARYLKHNDNTKAFLRIQAREYDVSISTIRKVIMREGGYAEPISIDVTKYQIVYATPWGWNSDIIEAHTEANNGKQDIHPNVDEKPVNGSHEKNRLAARNG